MASASSLLPSTSLPFPPTHKTITSSPSKTLTLKLSHLPKPLASSSSSPPPPPPDEAADPIKLAFVKAAAYKKEKANPPPPPPPPVKDSGEEAPDDGELAIARALEYKDKNGGGVGAAQFGVSPSSGQQKQNTMASEDGTLDKGVSKKEEFKFSEIDFLGLDFSEKKRYRGPPPGLAPIVDPVLDEDFPEVEIIIGDPSKFEKTPRSSVTEPGEDSKSEETSRSTIDELEEDSKFGKTPPSTIIEPEEDDNTELYKPKVSSWGVFPRPQNISRTYGGGRTIRVGGELQTAEEKAAKDKRTRALIAAYRNRQNLTIDAKTKAECKKALEEGDELMNAGKLRQALPYYEKVMKDVDFQTELHGMAALQWSICQDSLCRSKEARVMYSKLKYHPNIEISKKANMFMFSFQAMEFMKVTSSPLPRNTGYETYFDKFADQKNYYTSQEEPDGGLNQLIPYLIFLVSPIFVVAFVALSKSFRL